MSENTLSVPTLPAAYRLVARESVDSTMNVARDLAEQGEDAAPDGTLVWAREQTAGHGRRGNPWQSEKGNFHISLIVRPDVMAADAAQLGFVTGCAVYDTIGELCEPGIACRLKWPNDILVNDSKIGGLLLEAKSSPGAPVDYVIIGLGINLLSHPRDTEFPATDFVAEGQMVPDTEFLQAFCRQFMDWAGRWVEEGFEPIRAQWKWRARGLDDEITVRFANEELHGIFKDIAEDGSLVLETGGEIRNISAGEVLFPGAGA